MQKLRLSVQGRKPGFDKRGQKRSGTAIEYRRLGRIHVDRDVVDADSGDGGENVFDRMNGSLSLSEARVTVAPAYFTDVCFYSGRAHAISAAKDDPLSRFCRLKGDAAYDTEVQPDPLQHHRPGQSLPAHFVSCVSRSFSRRRIIPANLNRAPEARSASR